MAISVPSAQEVADKWATVTPQRLTDYTKGVQGAASRWQTGVDSAGQLWSAAVIEAAGNGEWQRGVQGKGSKYSTNAATLGSQRWSGGIAAGKSGYQTGMSPVLSTIASLTLPARQTRGNPANMQRAAMVAEALHNLKITT